MRQKKLVLIDDPDGWTAYTGGVYRCPVFLSGQTNGGYQAVAAQMPDVAACGGTEGEALANVADALARAIPARRTPAGVPWGEVPATPSGALVRWVIADTRGSRP